MCKIGFFERRTKRVMNRLTKNSHGFNKIHQTYDRKIILTLCGTFEYVNVSMDDVLLQPISKV